jgi:hypothetical protein
MNQPKQTDRTDEEEQMYTANDIGKLKQVLDLEEKTQKELKDKIQYELSLKSAPDYIRKTYYNYQHVVVLGLKGLKKAIDEPTQKNTDPDKLARAICLLKADLEYIKHSVEDLH